MNSFETSKLVWRALKILGSAMEKTNILKQYFSQAQDYLTTTCLL